LVAVLASSCSREPSVDKKPTVAAILAVTGGADFIGKPERDVLKALQADHEKRADLPFDLEIHDSAGDPNQARNIFDDLCRRDEIIAVMGPSTSGESIPLAESATQRRIPLLSLAASKKIVVNDNGRTRDWAFKFAQNDELAAQRLATELHGRGHNTVALLYSNDGFGKSGAEVFKEAVEDSKVLTLAAPPQPFDPAIAQAEAVIEAVPAGVPALVIWGTAPGPALLVQAAKRLRPKVQIYLSHGNASPAFIASAGPASEGAIVVGSRVLLDPELLNEAIPADDVVLQFQKFWGSTFGTAPSHFGGHARDAFAAMLRVFKEYPSATRNDVRDTLEGLKGFPGVTGTFNFSRNDHAGLGPDAFAVYVIRSGKFVSAEKAR
jgi:branched-chain amino acid transport system substrate-binding protein